MGLHHCTTIFLCAGSYLCNFQETGAIIVYLHDLSDILASLSKCLCETVYTNTTGGIFIVFTFIWFYTRNLVFPYLIYITWNYDVPIDSWFVVPFFCFMLSALFLMHSYWMHLFIVMIYKFAVENKTDDVQEKSIESKKQ